MMRRLLATLFVTALSFGLTVRAADDPKKNTDTKAPPSKKDDVKVDPKDAVGEFTLHQERLKQQFNDFKNQLIRLAQRLEESSDPANKSKAKILRMAILKVSEEAVDVKFDSLVNLLKASAKEFSQDDLQTILERNADLRTDLRSIIAILMLDNRGEDLRRKREELEKRIRELKRIIFTEEKLSAKAREAKAEGDRLAKAQHNVTTDTKVLGGIGKGDSGKEGKNAKGDSKSEGKKSGDPKGEGKNDTKDAKSNPKEIKSLEAKKSEAKEAKNAEDKKGDPKDGKASDGKQGDPKEAGKKSDPSDKAGSKGDGKSDSKGKGDGKSDSKGDGKPSDSKPSDSKGGGKSGESQGSGKSGGKSPPADNKQKPPQDDLPGAKQIKDAADSQEKAEKKLPTDPKGGSKDVDDAEKKLKEVLKKWEELLKQLREEEVERILAALQGQCERMRALQIQILDGTQTVDKTIQESSDKKPTRVETQKSLELSDREQELVRMAQKCIDILAAEGSAVAFPLVFSQVQEDMINVARRLHATDTGSLTVTIEKDIIATLGEMIEALKKARKDNENQPPPPPGGGGGGPNTQKLIELIQELKMIRSMQIQVNKRTALYAKEYHGEQAPAPIDVTDPQDKEKAENLLRENKELSARQVKIATVVDNIAKGKNK